MQWRTRVAAVSEVLCFDIPTIGLWKLYVSFSKEISGLKCLKANNTYSRHFKREVILLFHKQMEKITETKPIQAAA